MNPNSNSIVMQNPLENPEILDHVLGYIKSSEILLKCRLVAHSWNQVAVQLLNTKNCTIGLDFSKLHPYVDSLKSNTNSTLSHLNANLRIKLPQRYSSDGSEYEREEIEFRLMVQLLLTSRIQVIGLTLSTNPRPLSLTTPIIACTSSTTDNHLQQLLEHVAPTLCYLKLNGPMNTGINYEPPAFPNLTSIHCFGSMSSNLCEYLTKCIVDSSKLQLKKLDLITNDSREVNPIFNSLKSQENLNLEKLDLSIDHVDTYNGLITLKSCHLKRLVVRLQARSLANLHVSNFVGAIISTNYTNLVTLEFYPTKGDGLLHDFLYHDTPLPQIKTFGFYLRTFNDSKGDYVSDTISDRYLRLLAKFPCLTTIKLDFEALIALAKYFTNLNNMNSTSIPYDTIPTIFRGRSQPLVTTMEVYLNLRCYGEDDGDARNLLGNTFYQPNIYRAINYLVFELWPNVANLTLKQKLMRKTSRHPNYYHSSMDPEPYPHVPYVLLKTIITSWNLRLRRLKIKNYVGDWLNTMVAMEQGRGGGGEGNISGTLSNLELLSIHGGARRRNSNSDVGNVLQNLRFVDDKKGKFDILHFLERIKSVAEIEVDEALLQIPSGSSCSTIMEQIVSRNLATNTNIQLI